MKVRKKPVEAEAIKWAGNNYTELEEFGCLYMKTGNHVTTGDIAIHAFDGRSVVKVGWWIVKEGEGEDVFHIYKPDEFDQIYEIT